MFAINFRRMGLQLRWLMTNAHRLARGKCKSARINTFSFGEYCNRTQVDRRCGIGNVPADRGTALAAQSLSLPSAIATAFSQNPELAAARWEIGIAQGDRVQAGLIPNPELSWEVEDTRSNSSTTTLLLSQTLELGGKRGARVDLAARGQSVAEIELERRSNDLRADVMQAFYTAARAQTGLELARQTQQLAERGLYVAQGRIRAGKSSPIEATRAEVLLAETRLQVKRAETVRASSYRELARETGSATLMFDRLDVEPLTVDALPPSRALLAGLNLAAELRLAEAGIARQEAALGSGVRNEYLTSPSA